ncbi:MAG: hypothetical protein FRX49_01538 [Trebouxia sp. A1-2]|nr:MAG: hypothetical protein FRX49_01538 [Trebouxia sp. A1-2]
MQESSGHMWVAAGTIFLDVLVWKVSYQSSSAHPLYRLKGHEGSIHRVSWNTSGTKLMSASDDRTVRLWTLALSSHNVKDSQQQQQQQQHEVICLQAAQVLYGHTSRLWDCQFGEGNGILVTASEDCTARVWDMTSGKQLCSLQGHKGRGVWRCLLHPNQDLLITAGADSSIKLWRLADWLPAHHPLAAQASDAFSLPPLPIPAAAVPEAAAVNCAAEPEAAAGADARVMAAPLPASSTAPSRAAVSSAAADIQSRQAGALEPPTALAATAAEGQVHSAASQPGQQDITTPHERKAAAASQGRDSKVEWVRCMKLADESMLFVGTNLGCLYSVSLPPDNSSSSPEWHLLYNSPRKAAITSLQVVQPDVQANPQGANAPAAQHSTAGSGASAGAELQNLWVIFGDIQVSSPSSASSGSGAPGQVAAAGQAKLLAEIRGPVGRGSQIVALDACPKRGLLMCGDMIGTVMGFAVPSELLQSFTAGNSTPAQMQPCAVFRQQHAKSVMIVKLTSTDIMSAGNDGRICRYHWQRQSHSNAVQPQTIQGLAESGTGGESQTGSRCVEGTSGTGSLQCVAEERLPSIATVLDVVTLPGSQEQLVCGFQSSDWVVFNTIQQLELMRIPCGGWHRPFTFHCLSPTHLIFVHYQPRSSSIHVHRRRRPVPPLLTPPASDGGPRGLKQGSEGSEGVALGSERGKQRLRELAHWSKRGVDGSYAGVEDGTMRQLLYNPEERCPGQASQSPSGQQPPLDGELHLRNGQTQSCSEQNQLVNGESLPNSQQSETFNGQNGSSSRQSLPRDEQEGSTAGGSGHLRGLFGTDEVGFQAAGSAVKSIVTIPAAPGRWLVVTAGAKEVLMAWLLQWNQDCEGKWHLSHHWLSTRPPPRRGLRPVANAKGQNSVSSDLRCMALAGWSRGALPQGDLEQGRSAQDDSAECSSAQAHIITSSSDATMSLVHFDWRTHRSVSLSEADTQAARLMAEQLEARCTPEQAFCAAIRLLAEHPPQASALEAGHKEGFTNGLLLFEPLYSLLVGNADNLSIDRFANHLMQLTSNKVRVSLGSYWKDQSRFDDALLVQHPSKKPMSLAKLMEILRQSCTSIWLAQTAGVEGRRLMHALQQPNLPAEDLPAPPLLANLPVLPDRHAVVEQRLSVGTGEPACLAHSLFKPNCFTPEAAGHALAAQSRPSVALHSREASKQNMSVDMLCTRWLALNGLSRLAVHHMERGLLSRGTRASARQAALFQDRMAAGDAAKQTVSSEPSETGDIAEGHPLSEQDSFYTASEGTDEEGNGNGNGGDEGDDARQWDSSCPEPFPWDGKSSLMVCIDPEQRIWYQAHVLKQRGNQYLLSWSAFPDRPEEWVAKNSRRIWRQDQIKREYWHQRAPVFLQSRNRAWVLKACFWDWQMSSRSDHLLHKEPGALPCP